MSLVNHIEARIGFSRKRKKVTYVSFRNPILRICCSFTEEKKSIISSKLFFFFILNSERNSNSPNGIEKTVFMLVSWALALRIQGRRKIYEQKCIRSTT